LHLPLDLYQFKPHNIFRKVFFLQLNQFTDNYPTHSGESFASSDISLDGSTNFDQLDETASDSMSLQTLEPVSHSHPMDIPGMTNFGPVNPIDKLYLMQNSYFSTEQ